MAMLVLLMLFSIAITNTAPIHFNTTPNGFPKVLWSYWDQGIEQAPFFTQLCLKSRIKIAEENGWQHVLLTGANYHEYIDHEEVEKYLSLAKMGYIQIKADILRYLLIIKYGGLWIDINSYLLRDLSWVSNPNQTYIHNKLGQSPDLIIAAYSKGSGHPNMRTHKSGELVNIFPIYENWMILGKPNSQFLKDCLKIYVETHQKTKEKMDQQNLQKGIILPEQINIYYFIVSDYSQQITIQRKQKELQQQQSPLLAIEYYKIWQLEAHQSAFKAFLDYEQYIVPLWVDYSTYSTQEIQQGRQIPFFRKYIGWHHFVFSHYLKRYADLNCWGLDIFIEEGSEIDHSLVNYAHNQLFMKDIDEISNNIDSKDYCIKHITEGQTQVLSTILWSWYIISLSMAFIMIYCCYYLADKKAEIERSPTQAQ